MKSLKEKREVLRLAVCYEPSTMTHEPLKGESDVLKKHSGMHGMHMFGNSFQQIVHQLRIVG